MNALENPCVNILHCSMAPDFEISLPPRRSRGEDNGTGQIHAQANPNRANILNILEKRKPMCSIYWFSVYNTLEIGESDCSFCLRRGAVVTGATSVLSCAGARLLNTWVCVRSWQRSARGARIAYRCTNCRLPRRMNRWLRLRCRARAGICAGAPN